MKFIDFPLVGNIQTTVNRDLVEMVAWEEDGGLAVVKVMIGGRWIQSSHIDHVKASGIYQAIICDETF